MSTDARERKSSDSRERKGDLIEKIIKIRRCAAVVKGGRRFSFNGMVVVGNGRGKVGCGYGKANEVPPAVEKATKDGERSGISELLTSCSCRLAPAPA
jgi:small subunit ribosomal protein S5